MITLRRIAIAGPAVIWLLATLTLASGAVAHEGVTVGDYEIEVGWRTEPPTIGKPNAVQVSVSTHDDEQPVTDLVAGDLRVVVSSVGPAGSSLELVPAFDPGATEGPLGTYEANLVPTVPGAATFHITGSIHGTPVDVTVDAALVLEPYRYLHPSGDQVGAPTSFSSMVAVAAGVTPPFVAITSENPAQAQLIALRDAFELAPGVASIQVSITPVGAPAPPPGASIAGNVYRFVVTDQAGVALPLKACDGCISILLHAPEGTAEASIKRYTAGAWVDVETVKAGVDDLFQANPTVMGDYAIVVAAESASGFDPVLLGGGVVLLLLFGGIAFLLLRVRAAPPSPDR